MNAPITDAFFLVNHEGMIRKPRDYDAELKALDERTRQFGQKRIVHLGKLVVACGADRLSHEQLAGALLRLGRANAKTAEEWRPIGAAFFQGSPRRADHGDDGLHDSLRPGHSDTPSA